MSAIKNNTKINIQKGIQQTLTAFTGQKDKINNKKS
jgi:hypothetical protein